MGGTSFSASVLHATTLRGRKLVLAMLSSSILVSGCAEFDRFKRAETEQLAITGAPVTSNTTPLENAFACMSERMKAHAPLYGKGSGPGTLRLTVGDVKDFTGKFSEGDGGYPVTQGGALMVISALGKLDGAVRIHERFDTNVADREFVYLEQRKLGDGRTHIVPGAPGNGEVPWVPYFGGTVMKTDYFIVGGITELNWNISSGGAEARVGGVGPKMRTYTINVAVDLRIVDTQTLEVRGTTSLQKQIVGYEVGAELFRFFDDTLVDINAGRKEQEPLQLGVRTTLELGVLELVGKVAGVDHTGCVSFDSLKNPAPEELYVMADG